MEDIVKKMVRESSEHMEKVIKESAEQGYNYMAVKKDIQLSENFTVKGTIRYLPFMYESDIEIFEKQGYEVYDLTKVKEYLKNQK